MHVLIKDVLIKEIAYVIEKLSKSQKFDEILDSSG